MTHSIHFKPSSINTLKNVVFLIAPFIVVIAIVSFLPLGNFWHTLPFIKWQAVGIFQFLFVLCLYPIAWLIGKFMYGGDAFEEIEHLYYILFGESLLVCLLAVFSQVFTR